MGKLAGKGNFVVNTGILGKVDLEVWVKVHNGAEGTTLI